MSANKIETLMTVSNLSVTTNCKKRENSEKKLRKTKRTEWERRKNETKKVR